MDLEQRKAAFDASSTRTATRSRTPAGCAGARDRELAKEALWRACRAYDRRRMDETPIAELVAFAEAAYPVRRLSEYWGLQWRTKAGPAVCPYLQPLMLSAVHRRIRNMLWWRRWARQGV